MNIKKVDLKDLPELREIGIKSYMPHYTHMWNANGIEWYMNRCFSEKILQNALSDSNVEYYIVENNGENIGMMKLVLQKPIPDSELENALYLEKIYFVKEWTGKGIGKRFIDFALQRAVDLKRDHVWLTAMDTAAKPIKAYEKAGFTIHSYTNLGDEFELMKKEYRGMVVMKICLKK